MQRMNKLFLICLLALYLLSGCSDKTQDEVDSSEKQEELVKDTSLAGLSLGDDIDMVTKTLGEDFEETILDVEYPWGEFTLHRTYSNGVGVIFGKDSHKVYQVSVSNPEYQTSLGVHVGERADDLLEKYRSIYEEHKGIYSEGKLDGWFEVDKGMLLIFDFDKDDTSRVNMNITNQSKVEEIVLAYAKHFE